MRHIYSKPPIARCTLRFGWTYTTKTQAHCPVPNCRPMFSTLKPCSPFTACHMKRLATTLKPVRTTKGVSLRAVSASGNSPKDDTHKSESPWNPRRREFEEYRDTEKHPSYRRVDMSVEHAATARRSFLSTISCGEGTMDLALAALYIAAEDDAIGECHDRETVEEGDTTHKGGVHCTCCIRFSEPRFFSSSKIALIHLCSVSLNS